MLRRHSTLILGAALVAACARAGGDSIGGELTPAGQLAETPGVFTSPGTFPNGPCGTGSTFHELYRDIFGPTGQPGSCTFQTQCHGSPGSDEARSNGIKCKDETECYGSMRELADTAEGPETSTLWTVVRQLDANGKPIGKGIMPREPATYHFPSACMDRIRQWIVSGRPQ